MTQDRVNSKGQAPFGQDIGGYNEATTEGTLNNSAAGLFRKYSFKKQAISMRKDNSRENQKPGFVPTCQTIALKLDPP